MGSHFPGGHPEITLTDVRVPVENLLGDEGEGFVIAQKRLAGGRLAHAMRWIGAAQRALDLTAQRLLTRKAFGKELARHQGLQFMIADSAIDLYASRLMVLHCAWKVEHGLPHRQEVAMVKTFVSEAFGRIVDRAVQIHGAAGIAMDLPISRWYQDARAARIYDGASEVHRMVDRARAAQARRSAGRVDRDGLRRPVSPHAIAPTTTSSARRAEAEATRASRSSSLEPLERFLDEHGIGSGEAGVRADRRRALQRDVRGSPRRHGVRRCAGRRADRCRPAPTTCCARRACCAPSRRARGCRRCSPCATTPA